MTEGARALSDALKTNTTLTELDLWSEHEESVEDGRIASIANNQHKQADNGIEAEGARILCEALNVNTSLTTLFI